MQATLENSSLLLRPGVKELNYRESDGLQVWLLWDAPFDRTQIVIHDAKTDADTAFAIPANRAADAFAHPFAYIGAGDE